MDVTVAESGPCRRTVSIVVPAERVKAHVDKVFQDAAGQVQLKGFRPGKVPRKVLEQKYGEEIRSEAKETLINQSFEDAVRDQHLHPIGRPNVEGIGDGPLDEAAALEFKVLFDVKPEFEVGDVKGVEVPRGESEVSEDDVNNALQQLAAEKRTLNSVDEPVGDGDFVKMELVYKNEAGDVVLERSGAQLNTNIPIAGTDAETFAARLRGAEKGQDLSLEIEYPESFEKEDVRGTKGTVDMNVSEVLRVTPAPIDDDLAKGYDFENLDEMKEDLTKRLGQEKSRSNEQRTENDLINVLVNENPFDLPESMVADQLEHSLAEFKKRLEQSGAKDSELEKRVEEARPEAQQDAERRVRVFFLLDAIAKKEKIFVTEGDIEAELRQIAAQHSVAVNEVREHYEKNKLLADLRLSVMERKVRDFLRQHAKLTD